MTDYRESQIIWASKEVDKQGESALAVPDFLNAWFIIHHTSRPLEEAIRLTNKIVRGEYPKEQEFQRTNHGGPGNYRDTPVTFINGNTAPKAMHVPRLMSSLCDSGLWDEDRKEFVLEFLKIHPFEDGNGRTAAILMNVRLLGYGPYGSWQDEFVAVPTEDGWDEGYGSQIELVDWEDDEHGCGRPVIQMNV